MGGTCVLNKAFFALELIIVVFITALLLTSCSMRQWYPTMGAVVGGGAGSLAGPAGSAIGAGGGALVGEVIKGNAQIEEAQETIEALTHGDVSKLVENGLSEHQSAFDEFVSTIQRILLVAGVCLLLYLAIPLFVARKCAKQEAAKSLTRAPFPIKPSQKP